MTTTLGNPPLKTLPPSFSIKPCPNFSDKSPEEARKILQEEFVSLGNTGNEIQRRLEQIKTLNIKKVQKVFSLLTAVVKPTSESEKTSVEVIRKKINKRVTDEVKPIEIIAAMLLKGYSAMFFRKANTNLDYWRFEAEPIVKVAPMMLAKLENQHNFRGQFSEYPGWLIETMNQTVGPKKKNYKLFSVKAIGSSNAHTYYMKKTSESKTLKGKTSKVYEPLIFLLNQDQRGVNPIMILASKGAWEDVRPFCSERFSKHVSTGLAPYCIKTEQVYTKQLIGPSSSSDVQLRATVATDIDQRGVTCHAFTVAFHEFAGIEGKNIRIKFFEEGLYIDRKISLEDYEKFARFFISYDQYIQAKKGPTHEWGMPQLPTELARIVDEKIACDLDNAIAAYLAGGSAKIAGYEFDFELNDDIRLRADKFNVRVISHGHDNSFVSLPFESPEVELSLQEIKSAISRYQDGAFIHPPERWIFHLNKGNITLTYRVDGISHEKPLLQCLEGRIVLPDGAVYFKTSGRWYQSDETYCLQLRRLTSMLEQNFLKIGEEGFLSYIWDRTNVPEEDYSRLYLQYEPQKAWFDGNKKQISRVEICDSMLSTENSTYLYHFKKSGLIPNDPNIGTALREISSQLMASARIIRAEINKGINEDSELYRYCESIKGVRQSPLGAFKKKNIIFVLALPFPSGDALQALLNSRSTIARIEITQLKKQLTDLGFSFKIAPITVQN